MRTESNSPQWLSQLNSLNWVGLAICALAAGLQFTTETSQSTTTTVWAGGIAAALSVIGLIITGQGVATNPKCVPVLALAAVSSYLGYCGIRQEWDAVRLVPWVMTWVAAVAAIIIMLPR